MIRLLLRILCLSALGIQFAFAQDSLNVTRLWRQWGYNFAYDVAIHDHYAYIAIGANGLRILDIVDPANPFAVANLPGLGGMDAGTFSGDYAYVPGGDGLTILNIADPANPVAVGSCQTLSVKDIAVSGGYAYVAGEWHGLRIISISNPTAPVEVGHCDIPGDALGVAVQGNFAYVAIGDSGLRIIGIANPTLPTIVGHYQTPGFASHVIVVGNYAYVAAGAGGLRIINVSVPSAPTQAGYYMPPDFVKSIAIQGDYCVVADYAHGLRVINIANPASPVEVGYHGSTDYAVGVAVSGSVVCLAEWTYFGIYDVSAAIGLSTPSRLSPSPLAFSLSAYPNPFNATTEIRFDLPQRSQADLLIYDIEGRLVQTLTSRPFDAGAHTLNWDASPFSSGTYFARLIAPGFARTQKLMLVK
jgi:hypothetical protein